MKTKDIDVSEQTKKEAIRILDRAYQAVMSLISGVDDEGYLDQVQDALSGIDEVQNKIEDL
jgi:translation elongation factor EF-1beta